MSPEDAIRDYLAALRHPNLLIDLSLIERITERLAGELDPLERLRLRSELDAASRPDLSDRQEAFEQVVKEWAEATGVTAEAFVEEGVPPEVLRRSGLIPDGRSGPRASSGSRVSVNEVLAALPDGRFSITDLQEATGAARVTVSRAIAKAAAEGLVEEDGLAPRQGPGRRPVAYRRVRSDVS